MAAFYTYIAECSDGSLYTGYTTDLEKRLLVHNRGEGARYTRGRLPVHLVYWERHETRSAAMAREAQIKRWSRKKKQELVRSFAVRGREGCRKHIASAYDA